MVSDAMTAKTVPVPRIVGIAACASTTRRHNPANMKPLVIVTTTVGIISDCRTGMFRDHLEKNL